VKAASPGFSNSSSTVNTLTQPEIWANRHSHTQTGKKLVDTACLQLFKILCKFRQRDF